MRLRYIVLTTVCVLLALGCFRLSKWQVDRLAQRRARNALLAARLTASPVGPHSVPADTGDGHYRRVSIRGTYDYGREFALALRSRDGSPGVYILTPVRTAQGQTVLVNRGWVYAPDGMSVDLSLWREDSTVAIEGFLDTFVEPRGSVSMQDRPQLVRRLVRDSIRQRLSADSMLVPYIVVVTNPAPQSAPARLAPPSLTEGSHLSYAIQWAAFGVIAIVGIVLAVRRGVTERRSGDVAPSAAPG